MYRKDVCLLLGRGVGSDVLLGRGGPRTADAYLRSTVGANPNDVFLFRQGYNTAEVAEAPPTPPVDFPPPRALRAGLEAWFIEPDRAPVGPRPSAAYLASVVVDTYVPFNRLPSSVLTAWVTEYQTPQATRRQATTAAVVALPFSRTSMQPVHVWWSTPPATVTRRQVPIAGVTATFFYFMVIE